MNSQLLVLNKAPETTGRRHCAAMLDHVRQTRHDETFFPAQTRPAVKTEGTRDKIVTVGLQSGYLEQKTGQF